jgi:DNA-binding beta-propeller fold protein YncE
MRFPANDEPVFGGVALLRILHDGSHIAVELGAQPIANRYNFPDEHNEVVLHEERSTMKLIPPGISKMLLAALLLTHFGDAEATDVVDFQPQTDFLKLPEGWTLGAGSAVAVSGKGEVYLFHRGKHPVVCFDANGRYLRSWGDDLIKTAHGLRIDRDDNVWATDIGSHRVFKFDPTGKLLLALGTGKPGTGDDQFDKPTDIAFGPDGEIYISDGYGNSRVMKFSAQGKFLQSWGTPGKSPGEFNLPHAIVVDARGRVLVGDRENNRIQIFDREGHHLETWPGFAPYGLAFDRQGTLFAATGRENDILCLDATGKIQRRWGQKGTAPGEFDLPHMLAFDAKDNLYIAEVGGQRLQKLVRK